MSTELCVIPRTGTQDVPLYVTQFCGPVKKGIMLQLTQGEREMDCPGFIQLTQHDVERLLPYLASFVRATR